MLVLHKRHFISLLALLLTLTLISLVQAWTGPSSAPPSGNVDAPINVGSTDQIKNAALGLNGLAIFGNAIISTTNGYFNFGPTAGESGYGFRDNAGTMQVKDAGGTWSRFATTTSAGAFQQITFSDGTTQTTAGGSGVVAGGCSGAADMQESDEGQPPPTDGWGNAISCDQDPVCNAVTVRGSCPTGYTARRIGTGSIYCTGGSGGGNNCGCGSIYSYPAPTYKPSYYPAPMLCVKD